MYLLPVLLDLFLLNIYMKMSINPWKTTVKGLKSQANVRMTVRRIQNKIIDYGICSDRELDYLKQWTNWLEHNPGVKSNLD